jgi:hypothetical protein
MMNRLEDLELIAYAARTQPLLSDAYELEFSEKAWREWKA